MKKTPSTAEPLVTCPECGQANFSPRGLKAHQGGKTCRNRAAKTPLAEVTVESPECLHVKANFAGNTDGALAVSLAVQLEGLNGVEVIRWLERAVPAYQQARQQTALMGLSIGYALLVVRDFSPRGSLATLKKMQVFGRSVSTIERCMRLAQKFIEARQLTDATTGKLAAPSDPAAFFQSELDFGSSSALANPLRCTMEEWVGEASMAELLDSDLLGEDDAPMPPNGHQKDAASKRTKETPEGIRRESFKRVFKKFFKSFGAHEWAYLYQRAAPDMVKVGLDVGTLDLEDWLSKALAAVSAHNKEAAAKERTGKGGKAKS